MSRPRFVSRTDILSWGRVTRESQSIARPSFRNQLPDLVGDAHVGSKLAVGLRRSYGDSCLNGAGALIDMRGLDRFISFDPDTGILRAEAGLGFSDLLRLAVPKGWFVPTTPGTRFVTLGGALANDVHGKNHHSAGSFGRHVRAFGLLRSDSGRLTVTSDDDPRLFSSTIGGLGLTGVIEWVELQLVRIGSAYLEVETVPFDGLDGFWALAEESASAFEHTVAWLDCTARDFRKHRGLFSRANWLSDGVYDAHDDRAGPGVLFEAPSFTLNHYTASAFNSLYYRVKKMKRPKIRQHYAPFFYPLDALRDWNRLYGSPGMLQYQCVVPPQNQRQAIAALLDAAALSPEVPCLVVLKTFGSLPSPGLLSFARPGATLTLDFPFRGEATLKLLSQLDSITAEAGGALYPAKDGRMPRDMFRSSFPRWEQLVIDPAMSSNFWRRVAQ